MKDNNRQFNNGSTSSFQNPLIRWAGGKRLIVHRLTHFLPRTFGTYFEPMLGSGALFFALRPSSSVLADVNLELVNFYKVVKSAPLNFYRAIHPLRATKTGYYRLRQTSPSSRLARAARFFYLIRLSWNGLYRVNRKGEFNVPFGGRRPKELITLLAILGASQTLRKARLLCGDFEITTALAKPGDLVYFDPPYPKGASSDNGFARYHETGFTLEDHKRLSAHARTLAKRGVHVLVTEAATRHIRTLYEDDFNVRLVRSRSLIAASSDCRRAVYEAVITSYPVVRMAKPGKGE